VDVGTDKKQRTKGNSKIVKGIHEWYGTFDPLK
jgi:hypothetical protein